MSESNDRKRLEGMIVEVTREDFEGADWFSTTDCPVALAIKRNIRDKLDSIDVSGGQVTIVWTGEHGERLKEECDVPTDVLDKLVEAVDADTGEVHPPPPFTFALGESYVHAEPHRLLPNMRADLGGMTTIDRSPLLPRMDDHLTPAGSILRDLITYAQSNERVCPMPRRWSELYNILSPCGPDPRLDWIPAGPLILGGWWYTSVEEKRLRVREHLEYAASHGVLADVDRFVRSLPESQWAHKTDF